MCGLTTLDIVTRSIDLNQPVGPGCLHAIERVDAYPGGLVSNSGLAFVKLGIRTCAVSRVGDDLWGQAVRDSLAAGGLDVSGIAVSTAGQTATTIVLLDPSGERSFLFASGVGDALTSADILQQASALPRGSWVLFGYYSLFANVDRSLPELFQTLKRMGLRTALDCAGSGISDTPIDRLLPYLDCYVPSRAEAQHQTNKTEPREILQDFRQRGATGILGLKLGSHGALLSPSSGEFVEVSACAPPGPVIDTTGAGDAFYAGFLAGLVRGLNISDAGRLAAATGAYCVTGIGASAGLQDWPTTCRLAGIVASHQATA